MSDKFVKTDQQRVRLPSSNAPAYPTFVGPLSHKPTGAPNGTAHTGQGYTPLPPLPLQHEDSFATIRTPFGCISCISSRLTYTRIQIGLILP